MKSVEGVLNDDDGFGISDFIVLSWIAEVANKNGFKYGRKKVDRAIKLSTIGDDGEVAQMEKSVLRALFGVYGRDGAHGRGGLTDADKQPIGGPSDDGADDDAETRGQARSGEDIGAPFATGAGISTTGREA